MARSQFRSKRKVSGGRYINFRKTRSCELGGISAHTQIGEKNSVKTKRVLGGNKKYAMLEAATVNVCEGNKTTNLKVLSVENNPANIHFTRRNIVTKGAIVKTEKGDVQITSRPGQDGVLFGILVK